MASLLPQLKYLLAVLVLAPSCPAREYAAQPNGPDQHILWQIGVPGRDAAEFALGPNAWREFGHRFNDDPVFVIGLSDAKRDWPYVQPGPADSWAGRRSHDFTIVFGLGKVPSEGECRFVVDLIDTQSQLPPAWRVDINGHPSDLQLPAGAGDDSVNGKASAGKVHRCEVAIPMSSLRAGNNTIAIRSMAGSWAVYDWIGFEAPIALRLADAQPETSIVDCRARPVLHRHSNGDTSQQLQLIIRHIGKTEEAAVSVSDAPASPLVLAQGTQRIDVMAPAVAQPKSVKVAVRVAGSDIASREVELRPVRPWVVYLLPHSHNDIGYTQVQSEVEQKQWKNLDDAIAATVRTADNPIGSRFKWNVEVMWAVDSYLQQSSQEQQQQFIDAVRDGRVELDALYGNELTGLCRPEELMRLVECAQRVARRCGVRLESAMITDVPGWSWGMVPALAQAGVKYLSAGPNPSDRIGRTLSEWGDRPFYWVGPSGQDRVLCWVAGTGYGFFHGSTLSQMGEGPVLRYLERLTDNGYPYDLVQMRYSTGGDNGPPDPGVCDFVKKWNEKYASPTFVIATASQMFHDLETRYGTEIPTAAGDFTPYWEDGAASSARETALNRAAADRLSQAESLFAMLKPSAYPSGDFALAWRAAILYDEHTWGAWNSISEPDAPFVAQQWRVKQAFALQADKQSRDLLERSLGGRGETLAGALDVFNTTGWTRTDLVAVPVELNSAGKHVTDENGTPVPSQKLSTGELVFLAADIPPFGSRRYHLAAGAPASQGGADARGCILASRSFEVRIDEQSGAIASVRNAARRLELVDAAAPIALNDYRYMLGSDAAGAKGTGPVTIRVKEPGPLVASLLVESKAPGCRGLTREVRVIEGLERVEIINTLDKLPVRQKEGVHFGFAFNVPDGQVRLDIPWGVVRPDLDQLPGGCRNWFTVQRWVDISNADAGITWATPDAPLVEIGGLTADRIGSLSDPGEWLSSVPESRTLYSWAMNNHWHTNYRAEQEGPTVFRYSITAHGPYDAGAAHRFGVECSQPLVAAVAARVPPPGSPLVEVLPASVMVTSLRPSTDGKALIVRLFNVGAEPVTPSLRWRADEPRILRRGGPSDEAGEEIHGAIVLPPWGIATLRCERP